ncbi:MAG: hypothetical protein R3B97_12765 [Dehalococcoidia bacterium]|nr:hypothetical protein [Dehalococcoidia bacterium]
MGAFHDAIQARGKFSVAADFADLQPDNVTFGPFPTTSTEVGVAPRDTGDYSALCQQMIDAWFRTDIQYEDECEAVEVDSRDGSRATDTTPAAIRVLKMFRTLPSLLPEAARALAERLGIPVPPLR